MRGVRGRTVFELDPAVPVPASVDASSVLVRTAPLWLRIVWRGPFVAMATGRTVYLRDDAERFAVEELRGVLQHELVHVAQWRRLGRRRFLVAYVGDYLAGRRAGLSHLDAYAAIELERQARQDSDQIET